MNAIPTTDTDDQNTVIALVTAAQITENCPDNLRDLGERISTHLKKAEQCDKKAEDHRISAGLLLIQARTACNSEGFDAFRERFKLGKTRTYELLSIASGRTTLTEVRAATAKRMQKHRAEKKAASQSVTVTDSKPSWLAVHYPFLQSEKYGPEPVEQPPTTLPRRRVDRRLECFVSAILQIHTYAEAICDDIEFPSNLTAEQAADQLIDIREAIGNLGRLEAALAAIAQSHEAA